ncbi:hypothetical protein N7520_010964 [Penicillium odoratum]|uniref:uncharacterized protein n=1 Tax=Penicillium odoratum TaxID=1167516 RepID=UPI0025484995|nr:uncharacterized protein N7520_010964 [Penicillium odoratum]KAJ5745782.1 hypothetical protein N7520_010964 [Penicillium odoratum]
MAVNRSTKVLRDMVVLPEMEENGVRIENKDEVIGWLMQERTWGGITSTNITWIFHRLHREREESGVEDEDESEEERGWVVRGPLLILKK